MNAVETRRIASLFRTSSMKMPDQMTTDKM
jgi:hypothetical protein